MSMRGMEQQACGWSDTGGADAETAVMILCVCVFVCVCVCVCVRARVHVHAVRVGVLSPLAPLQLTSV